MLHEKMGIRMTTWKRGDCHTFTSIAFQSAASCGAAFVRNCTAVSEEFREETSSEYWSMQLCVETLGSEVFFSTALTDFHD